VDDDLELVLVERVPGDPVRRWVPAYRFEMRQTVGGALMGRIELRAGDTESLRQYAGHIGYGVEPIYRGNHFAARSVVLLLPLARAHGIDPLWITCGPDNIASRRTCELAGGCFVQVVDIPADHGMYAGGHRRVCRYRFDLWQAPTHR
jgi:predicted acetyltransferase